LLSGQLYAKGDEEDKGEDRGQRKGHCSVFGHLDSSFQQWGSLSLFIAGNVDMSNVSKACNLLAFVESVFMTC
jgi:hypothetical protein